MRSIAVLYATREGHTSRIAAHIADALRERGFEAEAHDVRVLPPDFDLARHSAAILAASVHGGHHEGEMVAFVRARRAILEAFPTAFLSVSLTETTVEDPHADPKARAEAAAEVQRIMRVFLGDTGWRPDRARPVAGALLYTHYGVIKRFVMKMIARRMGGPTDTAHDYVFTNWMALDRIVDELVGALPRDSKAAPPAGASAPA
jgi:menaquinone-dependent protoporphyrinogen oxidase